jgi:hypothetical protein
VIWDSSLESLSSSNSVQYGQTNRGNNATELQVEGGRGTVLMWGIDPDDMATSAVCELTKMQLEGQSESQMTKFSGSNK